MPLLIPLDDLRKAPGRRMSLEARWELPPDWPEEEWALLEPASLQGEVALAGEEVRLQVELVARLRAICYRCLEPVEVTHRVRLDEVLLAPSLAEVVDLGPSVREAFYLELPSRFLCREDCRGLCPQCGQDLNQDECDCRPLVIDPRLEPLSRLIRPED